MRAIGAIGAIGGIAPIAGIGGTAAIEGIAAIVFHTGGVIATATVGSRYWPKDYQGALHGSRGEAKYSFPCFGTQCARIGKWHPVKTMCQQFLDPKITGPQKKQRMCARCADVVCRGIQQQPAVHSTPLTPGPMPSDVSGLPPATTTQQPGVEVPHPALHATSSDSSTSTKVQSACVTATTRGELLPATTTQRPRVEVLHPPSRATSSDSSTSKEVQSACATATTGGVCKALHLTHSDERKFGKHMWDEIATRIPRTQHNGTLAMPGNSKEAVDLEKLHDSFPKLPFIEPQPAQKRALALLKTSKDGQWNSELMKKSASFYQAEAANIQIVLCMPEVHARKEMMAHDRYRVKLAGGWHPDACKLDCPWCETNEFVIMGDLNIDTSIRYAYGNNESFMPVSRQYYCCNPQCPHVTKLRTATSVANLHHWTQFGLEHAIKDKKITELKRLGAPFPGHHTHVLLRLPPEVRSQYKGLIFWGFDGEHGQGGCTDEYAFKMIKAHSNLTELENDHLVVAKTREKQALERYCRFTKSQYQSTACGESWPPWHFANHSDSLLHPTTANIRTMLLDTVTA